MPLIRAFGRLNNLRTKQKDMQTRKRKKFEKLMWVQQRDIQKREVRKIRLNLVGGILRRFYQKFIDEFRIIRATHVKFGTVEEESKKKKSP